MGQMHLCRVSEHHCRVCCLDPGTVQDRRQSVAQPVHPHDRHARVTAKAPESRCEALRGDRLPKRVHEHKPTVSVRRARREPLRCLPSPQRPQYSDRARVQRLDRHEPPRPT